MAFFVHIRTEAWSIIVTTFPGTQQNDHHECWNHHSSRPLWGEWAGSPVVRDGLLLLAGYQGTSINCQALCSYMNRCSWMQNYSKSFTLANFLRFFLRTHGLFSMFLWLKTYSLAVEIAIADNPDGVNARSPRAGVYRERGLCPREGVRIYQSAWRNFEDGNAVRWAIVLSIANRLSFIHKGDIKHRAIYIHPDDIITRKDSRQRNYIERQAEVMTVAIGLGMQGHRVIWRIVRHIKWNITATLIKICRTIETGKTDIHAVKAVGIETNSIPTIDIRNAITAQVNRRVYRIAGIILDKVNRERLFVSKNFSVYPFRNVPWSIICRNGKRPIRE